MSSPMKYRNEQKENPLTAKPELFQAALDEFSQKSFHEASLNDMLKAVKMNKGSFYHRFYDKTDLYFCMVEMIAIDKMEYMRGKIDVPQMPLDFFEQLQLFAISGLEYARHEKRYYNFWRNYLSENAELRNTIKQTFPGFGDDLFEQLVSEAVISGHLSTKYSNEFICKTISIYFYNLDAFLTDNLEDKDIVSIIKQFICFLKHGLLNN